MLFKKEQTDFIWNKGRFRSPCFKKFSITKTASKNKPNDTRTLTRGFDMQKDLLVSFGGEMMIKKLVKTDAILEGPYR